MKLLIAGGSGFLGSHFIRYLSQKYPDYELYNLDRHNFMDDFSEVKEFKVPENYHFMANDVRDTKVIEKLAKDKDLILNFVSMGTEGVATTFTADFITTEMLGTFNLLEATRKFGIRRMIQASDYEVYGEARSTEGIARPSLETDSMFPTSPSASAKAGADNLVYTYFLRFQTPTVILRSASNFGPFQNPAKMVAYFIIQALEGKKVPIHGNGGYVRDWIYVKDQCEAFDKALHTKGIEGEIFNVGASNERTVIEMTEHILTILDRPKDLIEFIQDRPGREKRRAVDINKIREQLGWQAKTDFNKALEETVSWYVENHWWWEKRIKA